MVVGARLVEYRAGLNAALAAEPMQRLLSARINRAANYARILAPVRTGRYLASFKTIVGVRGTPPRAFARLLNDATDPQTRECYAIFLEFGTRHMRRQRILGRAADALKQQ